MSLSPCAGDLSSHAASSEGSVTFGGGEAGGEAGGSSKLTLHGTLEYRSTDAGEGRVGSLTCTVSPTPKRCSSENVPFLGSP